MESVGYISSMSFSLIVRCSTVDAGQLAVHSMNELL